MIDSFAKDGAYPLMVAFIRDQPFGLPESLLLSIFRELEQRAEPGTLRAWCHLFGKVWATDAAEQFAPAQDLVTLNELVNKFWSANRWGWARLHEVEDGLQVIHNGAPLSGDKAVQHLHWSCGLLEGFYEAIFKQLGADDSMKVRIEGATEDHFVLTLRLSA